MMLFRPHAWLAAVVFFPVLAGLIVIYTAGARAQAPQDVERTLEIATYPNEPWELVDINIGVQSVKDKIKVKSRDNLSKWGTDSVKFRDGADWFKRVSVRLRNVSGRPIYGMHAYLFFRPPGLQMLFSLPLARSKELTRDDPLQPGAEIDLSVSEALLDQTLERLKQYGGDASQSEVSFSVDSALFSDDLQWYRGKLLRPDPDVPNKWIPVDEPASAMPNRPGGPKY